MSSYQTKIENLLPKLSYKLQVQFAYNCAKDVSHLDSSTEGAKCLELVAKWLNDESSVSRAELLDTSTSATTAAYATSTSAAYAYATYASAYAYAYASAAATATCTTTAATAYAAAYAAASAAYASAAYAYASAASASAAYAYAASASATTKESKFEEYYLMLLDLVKGLSTLELLINNIDLKELGL